MAPEGKQELITTILSHAEFVALADRIDVILAQGERPLDSTQLELAEAVGNFMREYSLPKRTKQANLMMRTIL